jgi:hypothetical protein
MPKPVQEHLPRQGSWFLGGMFKVRDGEQQTNKSFSRSGHPKPAQLVLCSHTNVYINCEERQPF